MLPNIIRHPSHSSHTHTHTHILCHPLSSTLIQFHPISSTFIHFHPLSFTFIHFCLNRVVSKWSQFNYIQNQISHSLPLYTILHIKYSPTHIKHKIFLKHIFIISNILPLYDKMSRKLNNGVSNDKKK